MKEKKNGNTYPTEPLVNKGELPDLFRKPDGTRIEARSEWPALAETWRRMVVDMEYGGLPPEPGSVEVETLCHGSARVFPDGPGLHSYRVHCHGGEKPFSFCVKVLFPKKASAPVPAIINGDGCWWYISDAIARRVLEEECALVMFNRTEMAEDLGRGDVPDKHKRDGGIYDVYPGLTFGALSAWAWGYHRTVDLLERLDFIDRGKIAVTGHSRGGKTVLLAGATDERITLVNDNASCAAGAAVFRYIGDRGETLNILNSFPSWFGAGLRPYLGREEDIPFDQHCLLASIAPRLLLITYALDDRWSNPEGMVQGFRAAREAYRFLGAEEKIAFHLRAGHHKHDIEDWEALLDFIRVNWRGGKAKSSFNVHPYSHLAPAFSWKAPGK